MKVLYLYMFPLWGNGSGAWLRRLTYQLKRRYKEDYEAAILAPERRHWRHARIFRVNPEKIGVFVGNPELVGAKKYSKFTNHELLDTYTFYLEKSIKAVEEFKPDIIHAFHTVFLPSVAYRISNFYKIPYVITTHGSDLYYIQEDSRWRQFIKDASDKAKFITANSDFTRDWYLKIFGKELSKKTKTITAGVSTKVNFTKDVTWIDKKYNFKHEKMVLFSGRLTEHKGVEYLIKAAQKIEAEIVILGDGPERKYLEKLIGQYKLNNVHMLGYFSQKLAPINDFYLRADVYVAPSVWDEPLGMVVLEAMVRKTPVIVTRKGGTATMVKDGYNGFLVRPRSANMIAERVNLLLRDDRLRQKMGEHAYKVAVAKFAWSKIATKFYTIYKKAAQ